MHMGLKHNNIRYIEKNARVCYLTFKVFVPEDDCVRRIKHKNKQKTPEKQ